MRQTDTLARIGGDEFALIQLGVAEAEQAQALCRRLLAALVEPFDLDGHEVIITASIGVALAPTDAEEPARLLQHADVALYRAKDEGRNTFRFFEPEMDRRLQYRRALECDLRAALARDQIEVHYQLQVDLRSQKPVGVEALARWHHPVRGWVPPEEFISVAEETGLILPLGERVLRTACAQMIAWPGLRLSVNLSPVQFRHGDLVGLVTSASNESRFDAGRLELEVTEGVLLGDTGNALTTLASLRKLGVRIAMDDFGTGYSTSATCRSSRSTRSRSIGPSLARSSSAARPRRSCAPSSGWAIRWAYVPAPRAWRPSGSSPFSKGKVATRFRAIFSAGPFRPRTSPSSWSRPRARSRSSSGSPRRPAEFDPSAQSQEPF